MNGSRLARTLMFVMGAVAVLSFIGLITTAVISGGKFNRYGEVPIPGSAVIELPQGQVIVSFHVQKSGSTTAVPPLNLDIEPPPGGRDPLLTDDLGSSSTAGDGVRRQVWVMQVPQAGRYPVSIDGPVADYDNPRLAFGTDRSMDGPIWVLVAASMISVDIAIAAWWVQRRSKVAAAPAGPDEAIRLEQLKNIAALRDSGALTESEFEAEKRRILEGQ